MKSVLVGKLERHYWAHRLTILSAALTLALVGCGGLADAPPPASDGSGGSGGSPLSISTLSLPDGQTQAPYQTTLSAQGGTSPYTWRLRSGQIPAGLTLDSGGQIFGTPTESGQFSFAVEVQDSSQPPQAANKSLDLNISPVQQSSLQITTNALATARIQQPYQTTLSATGGTPPYTWQKIAGILPLGLMLGAGSGEISGTPTESGQFGFTAEVEDSAQPPLTATKTFTLSVTDTQLDQYGGLVDRPCSGGATGFFYTEKQSDGRWTFCTPEGNSFFLKAVFTVGTTDGSAAYQSRINAKYGSTAQACPHFARRLKEWGFNALASFWHVSCLPFENLEKMPWLQTMRPGAKSVGASNCDGHISEPVKNLVNGLDGFVAGIQKWGEMPDVFDPAFKTCVDGHVQDKENFFTNVTGTPSLDNDPWLIGTHLDEVDAWTGFGPGSEIPGMGGAMHFHLGFTIWAMSPTQNGFTDQEVHTKTEFIAWLQQSANKGPNYQSIAELNAAWGTSYTTFSSNGGWPNGTGLMDENGLGFTSSDCHFNLQCLTPAHQSDLENFLEYFTGKAAKPIADAIRTVFGPNHLVFSFEPTGSQEGMARRSVLRGIAPHIDVLETQVDPDNPAVIQQTYLEVQKPLSSWLGYTANADSPFNGTCCADELDFPTQAARGERYRAAINQMLTTTQGGDFPMVGFHWWEWVGKNSENRQWGIVTDPLDNAFDGAEAVSATVSCSPPTETLTCGGEAANYGDFLSIVREVNLSIFQTLLGNPSP